MLRFWIRHPGCWLIILACVTVMSGTLRALPQSSNRFPDNTRRVDPDVMAPIDSPRPMSHKLRQKYLKAQLEKMRKDAAKMAELATSIQEDLETVTENELPLKVVEKADQVEKLAKQIKNTAKGR